LTRVAEGLLAGADWAGNPRARTVTKRIFRGQQFSLVLFFPGARGRQGATEYEFDFPSVKVSCFCMNEHEWEARYQSGDMPWEKGEPAPGLVDFLAAHPELPRGTVAVPGCGTGHDVRAWARAGFEPWGFDVAPSAVRLSEQRTLEAGLKARFTLADFLADPAPQSFDWLFEHTCFCAIPLARRDAYVQALLRWLKPGGQFLAVHYMLTPGEGPPFGVTQEELWTRFSPHFELKQGWVPRSYSNRTGLELMLWWTRKMG
jgi:SAM-dependent methyltransferase